ncbi:MAG: hypothetical protein KF691_00035 [Phycisphaeraceae bacterium]|nr:hypothetical protein [Phycisphaeraceae bacterium]
METCQVPPQDRCTVIRYQLEHPEEPVWCEIGPEHESLQFGTGKGIVLRWQKGKPVEAVDTSE